MKHIVLIIYQLFFYVLDDPIEQCSNNIIDLRNLRSVEVEDVVKKISTLSEVRITISSNEEIVNFDKVFSLVKRQISILSLSISMDESFYETCFYDYFGEKTRKNFKVRFLQCES